MRDKRMREAIQTFAPYVFPEPKEGEPDELIGSYILEGSKPDINIVNYVFNFENNRDLEKMNRLTGCIEDEILGFLPENGKMMLDKTFIVSTTDFSYEEYKDSPFKFLKRIGFPREEWEKVHKVKIVRSVIMSPYLTPDYVDENYVERFIKYLREEIIKHSEQILMIFKGLK